jgi:hypothetical protein
MMRHEVRHPVRDHPRFSTPCSGEQQQRTFGVRRGLALLGIQTFKKIHLRRECVFRITFS